MPRVLVAYFTRTGTCHQVADLLATGRDWRIASVRDATPDRGYASALLDSLLRRCPPIRYDGPLPSDFDLVVLVFPVWASRVAGPMRSFLARWQPTLRHVALVPVMAGRGAERAAAEAAGMLRHPPLAVEPILQPMVADGSCRSRLQDLGDRLEELVARSQPARPAMRRAA